MKVDLNLFQSGPNAHDGSNSEMVVLDHEPTQQEIDVLSNKPNCLYAVDIVNNDYNVYLCKH